MHGEEHEVGQRWFVDSMKGLERMLVWRDGVMMKKKEKVPMRRVVPEDRERGGTRSVRRSWKKREVMQRASDVRRDAVVESWWGSLVGEGVGEEGGGSGDIVARAFVAAIAVGMSRFAPWAPRVVGWFIP